MKKNKLWLFLSLFAVLVLVLAACGDSDDTAGTGDTTPNATEGTAATPADPDVDLHSNPVFAAHGLDENFRFVEPVTISVGLWNRVADVEADETMWADWIREELLATHNIIVDFQPTPRWGEDDFQSTLLSAQEAPDVGYTFNNGMVTTIAGMGGIHNLYPYLTTYRDMLPNMFEQVTETNIFWNLNAETHELWTIAGRRASEGVQNTATFIRQDWLDILDLPIPNTLQEFEDTLIAFRDNVDQLTGVGNEVRVRSYFDTPEGGWGDTPNEEGYRFEYHYSTLTADRIVPYLVTTDVGWDARGLFDSFIPNAVTEREWFVYGFDDRRFHFEEAMREGLRVLNHWFHEDLLWDDFVISEVSDGQDLIRIGAVGAFHGNWDTPFRPGDGFTRTMRENVGEEATFVAINPFENDANVRRKFASGPVDRFAFLPTTNDNVIASLLYLDFMNRPDTLNFLQFGVEGLHHEVLPSGAFAMLPNDDWEPRENFSGGRNFDINPLMNGVWFDLIDESRALETAAFGYPGIAPEIVMEAFDLAVNNAQVFRNVITRERPTEEGMPIPLREFRDGVFARLIVTSTPDSFDADFTREYQAYMNLGADRIIEDRAAAWYELFGNADEMPAAGQ